MTHVFCPTWEKTFRNTAYIVLMNWPQVELLLPAEFLRKLFMQNPEQWFCVLLKVKTLVEEDLRDFSNLEKVLSLLKKCHREMPQHLPGSTLIFWVFQVIRGYAKTLREGKSRMIPQLQNFLNINADLEKTVGTIDLCFGHNDLLAGNFIDDGRRLWLIDWDYAGFNSPLFDLANLASNNDFPEILEQELLEMYLEQTISADLWKCYFAMKCASLLREAMWSMVSEIHSTLDFDYVKYTTGNLERFENTFAKFENILTNTLPKQAQIIIIGGGIIGCSVAYHLAKEGAKNVLLLERGQLTCGSTFHAAGLVGQLRSSANITCVLKNSVELYRTIEGETGQATGWKMNGGLRLACTKERWTELKRQATTAHSFGLEMELLSPNEAQELWPLMEVEDVIGAAFLPTDGQANPSDITQALAKGARMCGVTIVEETSVTGIRLENQQVAAVQTENGEILCETVVNCAGQWANELGKMTGVNVPLVSVEHQYLITEAIEGVTADLPTLRDPDKLTYWKEEVSGLVMGGYEPNPIAWDSKPIPKDFIFQLLPENLEHFEQLMLLAVERVPALENAGIRKLMNGPESFTPDGNFILGEAPEVKNYFVGAGFNAFGIAAAGGAGKALAEWILAGEPPMDLWVVDIRRFSNLHKNEDWVRNRTLELYGKHYTLSWPHEEHESGRPVLTSPIYEILKEQGACFGSKLGWERPNWFAPEEETAKDIYSYSRQNWFTARRRRTSCGAGTSGTF